MECRDHGGAAERELLPARLGDPDRLPDDESGGEVPERDDHARLHVLKLRFEVRATRFDLLRQGVAVTRRAALEHVDDGYPSPVQVYLAQQLVEQLACGSDEGLSLLVLVESGGFADE